MTVFSRVLYVVMIVTTLLPGLARADSFGLVVPAYFYPSSSSPLWPAMNTAAERVPLVTIMNPNSGPATWVDANYARVVHDLRASGGQVIAYVATTYGQKPLASVYAEIDLYRSQYEIDGIFLDEMSNTPNASTVNHYEAIYSYIKGVDPDWMVMGNPGTPTLEVYTSRPTADNIVVFESYASNYAGYSPSGWNEDYSRDHFSHLVHTESSPTTMLAHVEQAYEQNAGLIYVTDDVMNNPWDTLPSYWDQLVTAVETVNNGLIDGDFNLDGLLTHTDLQMIIDHPGVERYDVSGDGVTDEQDVRFWVEEILGSRPGDANLDGSVDLLDLSILAQNFSQLGGYTDGDFNLSGAVNLLDLSILAENFGYASVPEPVFGLLIFAAPLLRAGRA